MARGTSGDWISPVTVDDWEAFEALLNAAPAVASFSVEYKIKYVYATKDHTTLVDLVKKARSDLTSKAK